MAIEFTLPELGENVEKGDVVRVMVAVGDVVRPEQAVVELETDKATIEVPSSVGGKVLEVKVKVGQKVRVGQVVLVLDPVVQPAPDVPAPTRRSSDPNPKRRETDPLPLPPPRAAAVAPPDAPVANASRAAADPTASSGAGGGPARVPASVVDIMTARPPVAASAAAAAPAFDMASSVPAAPSVRRFARELGVDLAQVKGTGPGGRVNEDDVKQHVKAMANGGGRRLAAPGALAQVLPDFTKWGEVEVRPMSNIRRKTAEHLSVAWQAPHVTQNDKSDITALEEFRAVYGPRVEKAGGKLTVTAIVIKVLAAAIAKYPQFASSVDLANESIVFKKYCHIGVAVDTPNGLLVPVIRDANRKTVTQIAVELAGLSQKARDRKLTLEEMTGSVFSVTNLGGIGGTSFTPIINQPEVAILGISRTAIEPVYKGGQFVPRHMLPLSLSYDHRAIDGADAARFLRFVADGLEQPLTMVL
jgi:pyruvate dehydrogenase E2 component (dihydrolipoamide acetyltransferase)